jgi:glutaredoxin
MYKWVGPDGKIVYSDTPPPSNAKKLATKSLDTGPALSTVKLPPELAAAVGKNPVTFYSTANCPPCNDARNTLKKNGIPFAEKTIQNNDDVEKLKQATGDSRLPAMLINKSKFPGFNELEWRAALTAAGYPETSVLPKDYRYPAPEPATPVPAKQKAEDKAPEVLAPKESSPTGIRF